MAKQSFVLIYRAAHGAAEPWLFNEIGEFHKAEIRAANGKPIIIATVEPSNYLESLKSVENLKPDLIILNTESDSQVNALLKAEARNATKLCAGLSDCPAFIAPWANGEKKEAAMVVLNYLIAHKQST